MKPHGSVFSASTRARALLLGCVSPTEWDRNQRVSLIRLRGSTLLRVILFHDSQQVT